MSGRSGPIRLVIGTLAVIAVAGAIFFYGYSIGRNQAESTEAVPDLPPVVSTAGVVTTIAPTSTPGTEPVPTTTPAPAVTFPQTIISLVRSHSGHDVPDGATEFLDPTAIRDFAVGPSGMLWSAGPGGVAVWDPDGGSPTPLTLPDGTGPVGASTIAVSGTGEAWVGAGDLLWYWDRAEWHQSRYRTADRRPLEITALATPGDGSVWVATVDISPGDIAPVSYLHRGEGFFPGDVEVFVAPGYADGLSVDSDGTVWALIEGDIWRGVGDEWTFVAEGGFDFGISSFSPDGDGGVWFVAHAGLQHLGVDPTEPASVVLETTIDDRTGLGEMVRSVTVGPGGVPWALTTSWTEGGPVSELVRMTDHGRFPTPIDWWGSHIVAWEGSVWGRSRNELSRFDGSAFSTLRIDDAPPIGSVRSVATDRDGFLWTLGDDTIGSWDGTTWIMHDPTDLDWSEEEGNAWGPDWLAANHASPAWAGERCEPSIRGDAGWVHFEAPPGISPETCWVSDGAVGPDGTLWLLVDAPGRSLWRHDGETWSQEPITVDRNWITTVTVGPDGSAWGAGDGVQRLDQGGSAVHLEGVSLDSIAVAGDGSVWAASSWGIDGIWTLVDGVWARSGSLASASALVTATDGRIWALGRDPSGHQGVFRQTTSGSFELVASGSGFRVLAADTAAGVWSGHDGRLLHLQP